MRLLYTLKDPYRILYDRIRISTGIHNIVIEADPDLIP